MKYLLATLLVLVPRLAAADAKSEAKDRLDHAMKLYDDKQYNEALTELTTAYALDPRPELLYAIAQVQVALGNCPAATTFYKRFLDTKPDADSAAFAREAIATCAKTPVEPPKEPPKEPPPPPKESPPPVASSTTEEPWYGDYLGDGLVGGGVVLGVIGLLEYHSATSSRDNADGATDYASYQKAIDDAHGSRTIAVLAGIAGIGLVAGGVVHIVLHDRGSEHVQVAPTPGGGVVSFAARF
jgi:tetratricopeptide (TPR) repeat protein